MLATFTPAEAARITGVNVTLQRDWRRRGFLPSQDGHARFDALALSELLVLERLSARGIGPMQSKAVSDQCAATLLTEILTHHPEAYEGPVDELNLPHVFQEFDPDLLPSREDERKFHVWQYRARWITGGILRQRGYKLEANRRLFAWWPNGTHGFYASFEEVDGVVDPDSPDKARIDGALVFLELRTLGQGMLRRSGRPLVKVELSERESAPLSPELKRLLGEDRGAKIRPVPLRKVEG